MKVLKFLFLIFCLSSFSSCTELSLLEDERGRKKRGPKRVDWTDTKDIDETELKKPEAYDLSKCWHYKSGNLSLFGKLSLTSPIVNCIAQAIDKGLKPHCENKKKAKELLEHYKNKGEDEKAAAMEEYLLDLEETQYELADELYAMADEFDDIREELQDETARAIGGDKPSGWDRIAINLGNIVIKDQVGSFVRVLDSRARLACKGQLDFSKIKRKTRT